MNPYMRSGVFGHALSSDSVTVDNATAQGFVIPARAVSMLVSVSLEKCRFRLDGTDPTSAVGHPLDIDQHFEIFGDDMQYTKFISVSGTSSVIFVTFFA